MLKSTSDDMLDFAKRVNTIKESPMRKISAMLEKASEDSSIIAFGAGEPSLAPPLEIFEPMFKGLKKEAHKLTSYQSTRGAPHLRELISELLHNEEKINIEPNNICLTVGASEGLFVTMGTLVEKGDEVIIPNPTYIAYKPCIEIFGGKVVDIPVHWQDHFQMTPEEIAEKITKKTKAIVMLTPDNPTGRILDDKNVKGIVELAEEKNIWLITDDIYKDVQFEGKFKNSRTFGGYENTITCCSFSKSASMPGIRIGYTYGPSNFIEAFQKELQYVHLCVPKIVMPCLEKFLENKAEIKNEFVSKVVIPTYKKRRDTMVDCMKKYLPDVGFSKPKGAFYIFADFNKCMAGCENDEELSNKIFNEKKVVTVPGHYFGSEGKNHLRFTYVTENEKRIEEGIKKVSDAIS